MLSALPVLSKKPNTRRVAHGVIISWTAPKNSLNETVMYNVECFICHEQSICNTSCYNQSISNTSCYSQSLCNTSCCDQSICNTTCYNESCCNTTWYDQTICNISCNNQSVCTFPCANEMYHPRAKEFNQTSVEVSNLTVGERYVFRVYAINSLNNHVSKNQWSYSETYPVEVSSGKKIHQMDGSQ